VILLKVWKQLSGKDIKIRSMGSRGIITDLGQKKQSEDIGYPDNITPDEVEWAREQGANTDDEILDTIQADKNKES